MKRWLEGLEKPKFDAERFFAGILFGVIIVLSVLLLNRFGFFFICSILILSSVYELFFIYDLSSPKYFILPGILSVITAYSYAFFGSMYLILALFLSFFLIVLKNVLFFKAEKGRTLFLDIFAVIYAGFFLSFLLKIFSLPGGRLLLLLLFVIIWSLDIFAYYGGRHFGRHKLYETLSPKKTIEGAIIGFVFAMIVAIIFRSLMLTIVFTDVKFNLSLYIFICGFTIIAGIIGDLIESLIKRNGDKKDSGHLIPGHGGILDRIDSLILAAPVFYYMFFYLILKK
jgi:CDP-diglyceride synthetase